MTEPTFAQLQHDYAMALELIDGLRRQRDACVEALEHVQTCLTCAEEPWKDCAGGRKALVALAAAKGHHDGH